MYKASEIERFVRAADAAMHPGDPPRERPATIPEQIAEALVRDIASGSLGPGDRLLEVDLAQRFGVARGTIREALHGLDKDGLVDITSRRGIYVHRPTADDIREIYELRAALFAFAAGKVIDNANAPIIALASDGSALLKRVAATASAPLDDFLAVRKGIGDLVLVAAGNRRLSETMVRLGRLSIIHRRAMENPERRRAATRLWVILTGALVGRDHGAASAAARGLVENARDALLDQVEP